MRYLVLDALNLIYAQPEMRKLLKENHLAALERFLSRVGVLVRPDACRLVVVYDGGSEGPRPLIRSDDPNFLVINSLNQQPADLVIEEVVKKIRRRLGRQVSIDVATDDGSLRLMCQHFGADWLSADQFWERVVRGQRLQTEILERHCRKNKTIWTNRLEKFFPTGGD